MTSSLRCGQPGRRGRAARRRWCVALYGATTASWAGTGVRAVSGPAQMDLAPGTGRVAIRLVPSASVKRELPRALHSIAG